MSGYRRRPTPGAIVAFAMAVLWTAIAPAAEPNEQTNFTNRPREIRVPRSELEPWLKRGWQPLPLDEYRTLTAPKPDENKQLGAAWIERAEYSATVVGGTLRDGRLQADVIRNGKEGQLLLLDPLNLALSDLKWSDGAAAIFGTAPDGGSKLLVDRPKGRFEGRWDLKGQPFSRGYRFDVHVAPGAVSLLRLRVPDGMRLTSSAGDVSGPEPADEQGWQVWEVQLGSETSSRLSVFGDDPKPGRSPMIFVNTEDSHVLRPDGLQVLSIFDLEVLESPVNRLEFVVPADFSVFAVTYGKEENVTWKLESAGAGAQRLIIDLPDSLLGRGRPIHIGGLLPRPADDKWTLPTLKLQNSSFLSGQLHLRVETPLDLQSFEKTEGFRRDATVAKGSQGNAYTFRRLLNDADMIVRTGSAHLDLGARVVNHFDATGQMWQLQSEIQWSAHTGSTYAVRCILPPQWDFVEVSPSTADAASKITYSEVRRSTDGSRVLIVEFLDTLAPNSPKTFRVACERIRASNQQLSALPILQPQDCGLVDNTLIVTHTSRSIARVEANAGVERVDEAGLPPFVVKSSVWQQLGDAALKRLLFVVKTSAAGQGGLIIENTEPSIDAEVETTIDLGPTESRESYLARITPKSDPVGKVLVYLSNTGAAPLWSIESEPPTTLAATVIPSARHAEWSLPAGGELWELVLAREQDRPFQIKGVRKAATAKNYASALLSLPGADGFAGVVRLVIGADVNVKIDTNELRDARKDNRLDLEADDVPDGAESTDRAWTYDGASASLVLTALAENATGDANQFATLRVRTIVGAGGRAKDLHHAKYRIVTNEPANRFRFQIPSPATFLSVRVNDRVVTPSLRGDEFVVSLPASEQTVAVDIQYETSPQSGLLLEQRTVPVPQTSSKVLSCDWEIAVGRDTGIARTDSTLVVDRQFGTVTWLERLFGPIGRAAGEGIFNPFSEASWRQQTSIDGDETVAKRADADAFPPPGFEVVQVRAAWSADSLSLRTWSFTRARTLGWIALLVCCGVALVLRLRNTATTTRVTALWLGATLVLAPFASPALAPLIGGALSGTLIALLLPRHLCLRRSRANAPDPIALGSTAQFGHSSFSLPLRLLAGAALLFAHNLPAQPVPAQPAAAPSEDDSHTVLLLDADDAQPAGSQSIVYLSQRLLDDLRTASAGRANENAYLVSSAEYRGRIDDQSLVSIDAEFRVAVLSQAATTRVILPLTNANLGGADACVVNGKPHPVFLAADNSGYELELARSESEQPPAAETFTVVFKTRPSTTALTDGARLTAKLPAAPISRLSLTFEREFSTVSVTGTSGDVVSDRQAAVVTANLGKTRDLDIAWSASQPAGAAQPAVEAAVSCLVEAHPTWLEYSYHVDYKVRSGQTEHMAWQLPPRSVVRSVASKSRNVDHSEVPTGQEGTTLFIDLPEPQTGEFAVDAVLLVPLESSGQEIRVYAPDLFAQQDGVKVTLNQVGIAAPSEFLLTAKSTESEHVARISADTFVSAAPADGRGARSPLFAYRLQSGATLSFDLALQPTLRKVRESQVGRVGRQDVVWTYSAEVETTGHPAFEHTLSVDRSLRLEIISVQEDKAERLVHGSRGEGDLVHLFLTDATSGTQQIELRGRMPLQLPATSALPLIRFEDARIVDSTLSLSREAEVSVELTDSAAIEPAEPADKRRTGAEPDVLVGRFRLKPNGQRPRMQVVRRSDHVRVDTATLVQKQPSGTWSFSTTLRFRGSAFRVPYFRVNVPSELADNYELKLVNAEARNETRDDGSVELVLTPTSDAENLVVANVSAPITPPSGPWILPRVAAIDAVAGTNYLLVSPPTSFEPEPAGSSGLAPETIPQWIGDAVGFAIEPNEWSAYTRDSSQTTLKKVQSPAVDEDIRVPLVTTECWLTPEGGIAGRTEIFAVANSGSRLMLGWPAGTELSTLSVDGEPTIAEPPESNELTIPLDPSRKTRAIVVLWSRPDSERLPRLGTLAKSIPQPLHANVERSLCTIVGPQGAKLLARKDFPRIDALEYSVVRLEGLLATLWESRGDDALQPALWELTTRAHANCLGELESLATPQQSDATTALRDRVRKAEEEIRTLRGSIGSPPGTGEPNSLAAQLERLGVHEPLHSADPNLVFAEFTAATEDPAIALWTVDRRLIAYLLCGLGLAGVCYVVGKYVRREFTNRLDDRFAASWIALGLFWWMCLAHSALGLLLVLFAVYIALLRRRRERMRARAIHA